MGLLKAPNNNKEQKILLKSRFEAGMDQLLGYNLMISPGLAAMKDGALSASYEYYGPDVHSSTDNELDMYAASIVNLMRYFGSGWMIEFNPDRSMSTAYPEARWPDSVSELIDLERRQQYQAEGAHFDTHFHLTITYMPEEMRNKSKKNRQLFQDYSDTAAKDEKYKLDRIEKHFEAELEKMESIIGRTLGMRRLEGSELLSYLHFCISGIKQKVAMPTFTIELDCYLAQNFIAGGQPKVNDNYISVLTISEFTQESCPDFMGFILQLPVEFRWSMRYVTLSREQSEGYLKTYRKDWRKKAMGFLGMIRSGAGNSHAIQYDEDAKDMVSGIDDSIKANNGDITRYGFLSNTLVIMDTNLANLDAKTKFVMGELQKNGFMVIRETLNASEAYLGSIPSHGYYNVRRPLMDSIFVSHAAPISRVWQGEEKAPCDLSGYKDQPALFYSATNGLTPFRFNLHVKDVGHAILIGPTGSGKSTFFALVMAQHRKYPNSHIYLLDKNYSSKGIIRSLGGNYLDPAKAKSGISFAPLAHIDVPEELEWACGFIENMLFLNKVNITSEIKESIRGALESLKQSPKEYWSIEHLIAQCDLNEIKKALTLYISSDMARRLLGGSEDSVEMGSIMGIEMGFLAKAPVGLTGPLLDYLFNMLSRQFEKGHPTLLLLDEAWFFMQHSTIGPKIEDWLKTLRKLNVSVIMASQSCSDILDSDMKSAIIDSCLTKVFLPNPNINDESQLSYQQLGLNSREVGIIKNAYPKKHYYVTSPMGQRLIDLGLGEVGKAFLANSDLEGKKLAELVHTHENWVYDWLMQKASEQKNPEKRQAMIDWANYWLNDLKGVDYEAA